MPFCVVELSTHEPHNSAAVVVNAKANTLLACRIFFCSFVSFGARRRDRAGDPGVTLDCLESAELTARNAPKITRRAGKFVLYFFVRSAITCLVSRHNKATEAGREIPRPGRRRPIPCAPRGALFG